MKNHALFAFLVATMLPVAAAAAPDGPFAPLPKRVCLEGTTICTQQYCAAPWAWVVHGDEMTCELPAAPVCEVRVVFPQGDPSAAAAISDGSCSGPATEQAMVAALAKYRERTQPAPCPYSAVTCAFLGWP